MLTKVIFGAAATAAALTALPATADASVIIATAIIATAIAAIIIAATAIAITPATGRAPASMSATVPAIMEAMAATGCTPRLITAAIMALLRPALLSPPYYRGRYYGQRYRCGNGTTGAIVGGGGRIGRPRSAAASLPSRRRHHHRRFSAARLAPDRPRGDLLLRRFGLNRWLFPKKAGVGRTA